MHELIKPLCWLEGTWRTVKLAEGKFPTIKDFQYGEEITFTSSGQPMLNYQAQSYYPDQKPLHKEFGFLRRIPETNKIALVLAHNFGLTTVEEGEFHVDGECKRFDVSTTSISRPCEGNVRPLVTQVCYLLLCLSVEIKILKVYNLKTLIFSFFFCSWSASSNCWKVILCGKSSTWPRRTHRN